jgi:hypothetical protein
MEVRDSESVTEASTLSPAELLFPQSPASWTDRARFGDGTRGSDSIEIAISSVRDN